MIQLSGNYIKDLNAYKKAAGVSFAKGEHPKYDQLKQMIAAHNNPKNAASGFGGDRAASKRIRLTKKAGFMSLVAQAS